MQFSKDTCRWTILGQAADIQHSEQLGRVLVALEEAGEKACHHSKPLPKWLVLPTTMPSRHCCQSASNFDPRSASNFDPLERRVRAVALAPSELVGVAETARARVGE